MNWYLLLGALFLAGCMHASVGWDDVPSRLLGIGGLFGAFVRAYSGQTARRGRSWWQGLIELFKQRWTLMHVLSGGAIATLIPGVFQWYYKVTIAGPPIFMLGLGFVVGVSGNFILVAALWKFGVFKDDPRAAVPENGDPPPPPAPSTDTGG